MFKDIFKFLISVFFSFSCLQMFSQFAGGSYDGSIMLKNPDCAPYPSVPNLFQGGSYDGSAMLKNPDCASFPAGPNIFAGGSYDGNVMLKNADCVPYPTGPNIFAGGSYDGFTMLKNADCAPYPAWPNIFKGGSYDGFARDAKSTDPACLTLLPIELLYFTAVLTTNQQVLCQWATATEINSDYFTVEKTKEGISYEEVGRLNGAGNSTMPLYYSMLDKNPYNGISYYRLKQTSYDGKNEYSGLVPVNLETIEIIIIYPNPSNTDFEYLIGSVEADNVKVLMIDATGRKVMEKTEAINKGLTKKNINVSTLSSGTYILQIITSNNRVTQKQFLK